jgi:CheY-like chemotaxis protein
MDAKMPEMDGLEATRLIKERRPEVRVVMLTMHRVYWASALAAGADVFLIKGCPVEDLLEAITEEKDVEPEGAARYQTIGGNAKMSQAVTDNRYQDQTRGEMPIPYAPADQVFRWGGLAAMISGALSLVAAMVSIVGILIPVIPDLVVYVLLMVSDVFIFFALIGFYGVQHKEMGGLGLAGFVLGLCGILFGFVVAPLGWLLLLAGLFLFAIASQRTGVLPAWGVWLWLLGASVAILGGILSVSVLFALGMMTAASGRTWLGNALWGNKTGSPVPAGSSERA